jgi:hypothetical protein
LIAPGELAMGIEQSIDAEDPNDYESIQNIYDDSDADDVM